MKIYVPSLLAPGSAFTRAVCLALATFALGVSSPGADLAPQLPIARATHSFSLWEAYPYYPGEEMVPSDGWPVIGVPPGYYEVREVFSFGVSGGTFDHEGVWLLV